MKEQNNSRINILNKNLLKKKKIKSHTPMLEKELKAIKSPNKLSTMEEDQLEPQKCFKKQSSFLINLLNYLKELLKDYLKVLEQLPEDLLIMDGLNDFIY